MALKNLEQRRAEKQDKKTARKSVVSQKQKAIQASQIAHVRAGMIGFTLEWQDTNPLGKDGESQLTASNKNRLQFNCAQEMWDDMKFRKWIVFEVFTWVTEVTLVFRLIKPRPGKTHREDLIQVRKTGRLRDPVLGENTPINNEVERHIMAELMANSSRPDNDKNKGEFVVANYKIVCVGQ